METDTTAKTIKTGYMQVVPGSYKPYPCAYCKQNTGGTHEPTCPLFGLAKKETTPYFQEPNLPYIDPFIWPSFQPQTQGEQCGRCWQNHTPGFVCACSCHNEKVTYTTTTTLLPDIGNDLDNPTVCGHTDPADI